MPSHRAQTCPRCQSPMIEGTMSTWHPDSFEPGTYEPTFLDRLFNRPPPGTRAWHCPLCDGYQIDQPPNPVAEEQRMRRYVQPTRWLIVTAWAAIAAAWAFFLIDALPQASVLGLLAVLLGITTLVVGRQCRYPNLDTLTRLYVYFAVSFLLYLAVFATLPPLPALAASRLYAFVSGIYVAATASLAHKAFNHPPRFKTTTHLCAHCGYLLYGLTHNRCPECGHPFNARLVTHSAAPRIHSPPPRFR